MSKELEKVIARLSQKSKPQPIKVEPVEPVQEEEYPDEEFEQEMEQEMDAEEPQELPPMPQPQQDVRGRGRPPVRPVQIQQPQGMPQRMAQQPQKQPIPQQRVSEQPKTTEDPETIRKIQEINAQVESLQNNGLFRVEWLYQMQIQNEHLRQIAETLKKLTGGDDNDGQ